MSKQVELKFKERVTEAGNTKVEASFHGKLLRMSPQFFSYQNADGEEIKYKLATVEFVDLNSITYRVPNVHVYETSVEQGMLAGETYLGKCEMNVDDKGNLSNPWWSLSSLLIGDTLTASDFKIEVGAGVKL